jgi:hydrogenase maturation protease
LAESWKGALADRLSEPAVVVGIGNSASGDDGVGPEVIRLLRGRTRAWLFDCQTAPENFIGPIARLKPGCIVLIDAVPPRDRPGHIGIFAVECMHETTFHTHASTPALFLDLLVERTGAECFLVGVEARQSGLGTRMSREAASAAAEIADAIADHLPPSENAE